jgi:phage/plasmid-like protein (TIGR03299 family)
MSEITNQAPDQQFSSREVPWLKLGRLVEQPATAAEAAKLAGLDFTVSLRDVAWLDPDNGFSHDITNRKAVVADDNGDFMGFASSSVYRPLQYAEAFDFMDTLGAPYVAAGGLRKRRQGFMVVKPDFDFDVIGGEDPHELYAVLRTSHDCTRGVEVSVMPLRNRCMNQLTLRTFSKGARYRWAIKHTGTMHAKLQEAQQSLSRLTAYAERYAQLVSQLVETDVKPERARELLQIVIPQPRTGKTERTHDQWVERVNTIMNMWQTSPAVGFAGTGWGLVNAVSEYLEWGRAGGTPESRFLNALEGQTHKKINHTVELLLTDHTDFSYVG